MIPVDPEFPNSKMDSNLYSVLCPWLKRSPVEPPPGSEATKPNLIVMKKNPLKLLILTSGALALAISSASSETVPTWNFGNNGDGTNQGWTVTAGFFANDGNGIEPAQANGNRAHDAAHPVAVLSSPTINFASVSATDAVVDILWEGGRGNQQDIASPANLAEVIAYNGGNTNNVGLKGMGFRNLSTGAYDLVDYDPQDGGGVQTGSYTLADLTAAGIDTGASYQLDFFTTDDGGWGWTRLNEVNLDANAIGAVPEPSAIALLAVSGLALLRRRR